VIKNCQIHVSLTFNLKVNEIYDDGCLNEKMKDCDGVMQHLHRIFGLTFGSTYLAKLLIRQNEKLRKKTLCGAVFSIQNLFS